MKNLINALMAVHGMSEEEARATAKQMVYEADHGYNPDAILAAMDLPNTLKFDLLNTYIVYP